ncbi:MAG: YlxR family protein [Thermodesulfobacteriota bacterium]
MRTCVICRTKAPKKELVRFALPANIAGSEKKGRGAYVCVEHDSVQIERYKKKLAKALRCDAEALHNHLMGESRS